MFINYEPIRTELAEIPPFIRFNRISLFYSVYGCFKLPIAEACRSVVNNLQCLKKALNDINMVHFICVINQNEPASFRDHFQFLSHIQNDVLPFCGSSCAYIFAIWLLSDWKAAANVITQILQMPTIHCCTNIQFFISSNDELIFNGLAEHNRFAELNIEAISNWLNQKCDGISGNSNGRFLEIDSPTHDFRNTHELFDYLKKVKFKFFLLTTFR